MEMSEEQKRKVWEEGLVTDYAGLTVFTIFMFFVNMSAGIFIGIISFVSLILRVAWRNWSDNKKRRRNIKME